MARRRATATQNPNKSKSKRKVCHCEAKCRGGREVCRQTWGKHNPKSKSPARQAAIQPEALDRSPGSAPEAGASGTGQVSHLYFALIVSAHKNTLISTLLVHHSLMMCLLLII